MGLSFSPGARIYLDTATVIYSVEKHTDYWPLLTDLWRSTRSNDITVVTSELTLLETLVQPVRKDDPDLNNILRGVVDKNRVHSVSDHYRCFARSGKTAGWSKL